MRFTALFVPTFLVAFAPAFARGQEQQSSPAAPASPIPERTPGHTTPSTPGYTYTAPAYAAPAYPGAPAYAAPAYVAPAYAPPQAAPAPQPTDSRENRDDPRYTDAHADRVVLVPTAETHPDGTVYFSSNEIILLQAGYAVSDRTQLTLTFTPPVFGDLIFLADVSAKTVLVREEMFRLALIGSATGIVGLNEGNFFFGRVTATAQFCLERPCRSSINFANSTLLAGPATFNYSGIGAIWRLSRLFAFLFEANNLMPLSRDAGPYNGLAIGPGVRFSGSALALDLAFQWAADADVADGESPPVLPWLALTYRVLP